MIQFCPRSGQYCKQKIMVPGTGKQMPCSTCRKHVTEARRLERAKKRNLSPSPPPSSEDGAEKEVDLCRKDIVTATTTMNQVCSQSGQCCKQKITDPQTGKQRPCSTCREHLADARRVLRAKKRNLSSSPPPAPSEDGAGEEVDLCRKDIVTATKTMSQICPQSGQHCKNNTIHPRTGRFGSCSTCRTIIASNKRVQRGKRKRRDDYLHQRNSSSLTSQSTLPTIKEEGKKAKKAKKVIPHFFNVNTNLGAPTLKVGHTHDISQRLATYRIGSPDSVMVAVVQVEDSNVAINLEEKVALFFPHLHYDGENYNIEWPRLRKWLVIEGYKMERDGVWRLRDVLFKTTSTRVGRLPKGEKCAR